MFKAQLQTRVLLWLWLVQGRQKEMELTINCFLPTFFHSSPQFILSSCCWMDFQMQMGSEVFSHDITSTASHLIAPYSRESHQSHKNEVQKYNLPTVTCTVNLEMPKCVKCLVSAYELCSFTKHFHNSIALKLRSKTVCSFTYFQTLKWH